MYNNYSFHNDFNYFMLYYKLKIGNDYRYCVQTRCIFKPPKLQHYTSKCIYINIILCTVHLRLQTRLDNGQLLEQRIFYQSHRGTTDDSVSLNGIKANPGYDL